LANLGQIDVVVMGLVTGLPWNQQNWEEVQAQSQHMGVEGSCMRFGSVGPLLWSVLCP